MIELWKLHYSSLTTQNSNKGAAVQGKKSAGSTPGRLNIIELSQISEKVMQATTIFLQKAMKTRHETVADLTDDAEQLREHMLQTARNQLQRKL